MSELVTTVLFLLFFAYFPLINWFRICKLVNEIKDWSSFLYFKIFVLLLEKDFALHQFS